MLTVVTSGKASPGATTAAWALSLAYPGPVLTCDCDPAGGDMAPGFLAGRVTLDRGLLSWSAATRRVPALDAATQLRLHVVQVPDAEMVWLLAGVQNAGQAAALNTPAWERLARALERVAIAMGRDVLLDAGRLSETTCWPVLRVADRVVVAVRPTVRSVHAAANAVAVLRSQLGDLDKVSVLVVADGPYGASEVCSTVGVPLAGQLPQDRAAAALLSDGIGATHGVRRSRLLRAARSVAAELARPVSNRRAGALR